MSKRLERNEYFKELSILTAKRGTCNKLQVGCVLVDAKTNRIAGVGYNSSHKGMPHCTDVGCLLVDDHCIRTLHAEQAAIMNLEHKYDELICYTTHQPCINCFKLLAAANVNIIRYINPYEDKSREILNVSLKIKQERI